MSFGLNESFLRPFYVSVSSALVAVNLTSVNARRRDKCSGWKHSAHNSTCFLSVSKISSCNSQDSSVARKQWGEVEFGARRRLLVECRGGVVTSRSTT
jgi:hypothetical protein